MSEIIAGVGIIGCGVISAACLKTARLFGPRPGTGKGIAAIAAGKHVYGSGRAR